MSNVIQGVGQPRFYIRTPAIATGIIQSSGPDIIEIIFDGDNSVSKLVATHGLIGFLVYSTGLNGPTHAVITNYDQDGLIYVKYWTNGEPRQNEFVFIANIVIDLPYCQRLVEYWQPDGVVKKRLNGDLKVKKKGFYYRAELYYDQYINANTLSLLRNLYRIDRKEIYFYPRVDNNGLFYQVDIDIDKEISLYQLKRHQGHGGIVINIIGLKRFSEAQIYNLPQAISVYGSGYGTNYGGAL